METKDFKGFKGVIDIYNRPNRYMFNYMAIYKAVQHFKEVYSRFDKRLATTKKKALVKFGREGFYVSMDFNKKHYGQFYQLDGCNDFKLPTINY